MSCLIPPQQQGLHLERAGMCLFSICIFLFLYLTGGDLIFSIKKSQKSCVAFHHKNTFEMFSKIGFLLLSQHFWIIGFARNNLHMFTFNQPTLAGSIKTILVNKADIHNLAKEWWSIETYLDTVLKAAVYFILYLYNMLRQPWNRGGGPFCQTSTLLNKKILMLVAPEREGIDLLQKYSRGKITSKIQFNRDHGNQSTSSSLQISRYSMSFDHL